MLQYLIRGRRDDLDLSRQDLAERTGLSLSYITMLENGQRTRLTRKTRDYLAHALGVSYATVEAVEAIPPGEMWIPPPPRVPAWP